jgi:epoxide hydrolase
MLVKPFKLSIPQSDVDDLQNRLKSARLPQMIEGTGWERGVPVVYLKKLVTHWNEAFDWRKQEAEINKYDQFTTEIDGQTIHFFHIRAQHDNAIPILLLHGWPSSSIEYLKVFDLITNPRSGKAFTVVAPTIPGFGLSSPVTKTGWHSPRTARAYTEIMKRLGYSRYGVHGSDIGADILGELLKIDGEHIIGAHMATDTSTIIYSVTAFMGGGDPSQNSTLSDAQKEQVKEIQNGWKEGDGYLKIQSTRPSTFSFGINDSPAGQLAWQVEKYKIWTNPEDELPEQKIDLDQMLTNISLYWFTGSGAASANYIYENYHVVRKWDAAPQHIPQGFAVFNAKTCARPLMDPERKIPHWSEFKEGQHFPAMEVPELFASDLQLFFNNLQ